MVIRAQGNEVRNIVIPSFMVKVVDLHKNIPATYLADSSQLDEAAWTISGIVTLQAPNTMHLCTTSNRLATTMAHTSFCPLPTSKSHKITSLLLSCHN